MQTDFEDSQYFRLWGLCKWDTSQKLHLFQRNHSALVVSSFKWCHILKVYVHLWCTTKVLSIQGYSSKAWPPETTDTVSLPASPRKILRQKYFSLTISCYDSKERRNKNTEARLAYIFEFFSETVEYFVMWR